MSPPTDGATPEGTPPSLWQRHPLRSIRNRLLAALLLPLAVLLVASAPFDYRLALAPSEQAYDEMLLTDAEALLDQVRVEDAHVRLDLNAQAERLFRADRSDTEYFALFDAAGRRLAGDGALPLVPAAGAARGLWMDVVLQPSREPVRLAG